MKKSCAFTGHRPVRFSFGYDETNDKCLKLKTVMSDWIETFIAGGINSFYSGFALGVDQWASAIVLDMKKKYEGVRLTAVLPCETQANNWSVKQRERYFDMLAQCDDVVTLNKKYTRSCMFERNRYLIDHAEYLLAVYDGSEHGGTAYTVQNGEQKARKVTIIHPDSLEVTSPVDIEALRFQGQIHVINGNS